MVEKEDLMILAIAAIAVVAIVALTLPSLGGLGYTAKEEKIMLHLELNNGLVQDGDTISSAETPVFPITIAATKKFYYADFTIVNLNNNCLDYYGTIESDTLFWNTGDTLAKCGPGRYRILVISEHRSGTELASSALLHLVA